MRIFLRHHVKMLVMNDLLCFVRYCITGCTSKYDEISAICFLSCLCPKTIKDPILICPGSPQLQDCTNILSTSTLSLQAAESAY
ncbi:hypothetical protein GDO78_017523 [Eleutherodactylus coqui]|uniref:Uncharacterized protein n=1 Tax=Eleutherodactylus coqui TaxID=57060 RepID=A0A8J6BCX0_ELECQ|nr:hypothetical protein GDO78_017523 [Eleutherodactylus coqui]